MRNRKSDALDDLMVERVAKLGRIARLAGAVCLEAPERKDKYVRAARVPWSLIFKLRKALADTGYDLDGARAAMRSEAER